MARRAPSSFFRYLRNSAFYTAVKRPPTAQEVQDPCRPWDVSRFPMKKAFRHPDLEAVWVIRQVLDQTAMANIRTLFEDLHDTGRFPWYNYEPGRDMMPLHASPGLDAQKSRAMLEGIEVFGEPNSLGADPVEGWPKLDDLLKRNAVGAAELLTLQGLPQEHFSDFSGQPCLFLQAQALERGAEVTPHRDALPYGGDMISTLVMEGSNTVRVGPVSFPVEPGDLYGIAGSARYDVEHEVMGASIDRFSITMRYGLGFRDTLPPLAGSAFQAKMGTSELFL
mmetsp:Transcript_53771/g.114789  ORF Transcript_53771/g.114789 Transcript_53771/m.114789 type:complete len:280 (-) Transcript_53771:134-973(-)